VSNTVWPVETPRRRDLSLSASRWASRSLEKSSCKTAFSSTNSSPFLSSTSSDISCWMHSTSTFSEISSEAINPNRRTHDDHQPQTAGRYRHRQIRRGSAGDLSNHPGLRRRRDDLSFSTEERRGHTDARTRRRPLVDTNRQTGFGGRHVDDHRTTECSLKHPILSEIDRFHVGGVTDDRKNDVGLLGHRGRGAMPDGAGGRFGCSGENPLTLSVPAGCVWRPAGLQVHRGRACAPVRPDYRRRRCWERRSSSAHR
jgi:hypothetical protein